MKRRIITYGRYFGEFMEGLTAKEREKVDYGLVLLKTQDRLPTKFVKHIRDGLYELNYEQSLMETYTKCFSFLMKGRLLCCFNGFQKKTQKTPASEITKALKIKEEYYEYKRNNDSGL